MADPTHLAQLEDGVDAWNEWRVQNPYVSEVSLRGVRLMKANFRRVNLYGADLREADFSEANLSGANLRGADLRWANFTGTNLQGANLGEAKLHRTVLGDTNLRGAVGLDSCNHVGPSTIDYQTLAKSGALALVFLRGCGLPDPLIEHLPVLLTKGTQFCSCFISYSTIDQEFADRLYADLQTKGVRCWFAPYDIQSGKKLHEQIDEAIHVYDRLLLILSEHSMNSEWVKTEIAHARQKELNEKRQVLFPISLVPFEKVRQWEYFDADIGKSSAREIREYFIPDFSNWKDHDLYQQSFERLVRDLKAEEKRPQVTTRGFRSVRAKSK